MCLKIIQYMDNTFPLGVETENYKYSIDNKLNFHWHHDFEYGMLLEGNIDYYISNSHIKLEKGDVIFINSNIIHMSKQSKNSEDAVMYTLTFPASFIASNANCAVYTKYVQPLLNTGIDGFLIMKENQLGQDIKTLLLQIYELEPSTFGYELSCLELFSRLWLATLKYTESNKNSLLYRTDDMRHSERLKGILLYIHQHFNEKFTSTDIANHLNISRGECFRCFKHFMNKTIVEYINEYRLQQAATLLRESEKSIIDISTECGFESASYFSKIFKKAYTMTPFQYKKALIWTDSTTHIINDYDYEYWKDSGNGTMIITSNANNGSYSCQWHNVNNIAFRSGKRFGSFKKTHKQLGNISVQYDTTYNAKGNAFLCVYGWTVDPLIEWYIVECYTAYKPAVNINCLGVAKVDGSTYELYNTTRVSEPSILGIATFNQYWSIRTSCRLSGTVDVSAHFHAWEEMGLELGKPNEISLSVEGWRSNGSATVNSNIVTINGNS